jgi:uncharacterized lipoprotein YmbA
MRSVPGAAALLVAGCMSLGPRPAPPRYYVLEAPAGPAEGARAPVAAVGIRRVRMPPYLDRREVVTREGATEVVVASADRWAAPLDLLFSSALAEGLRAGVPAREVVTEPWPGGSAPEWVVSVEVLRFEGERDGTAVLEARWTVKRRGEPAGAGVTAARERGARGDVAAGAAALSRTLGTLARDVAAAIAAGGG